MKGASVDAEFHGHGAHAETDAAKGPHNGRLLHHGKFTLELAIVERGIEALVRMTHRGGVARDGLSGDGCGLLLRQPTAFLRRLAEESGIAVRGHFASGLVFLPHDADDAARARDTLAALLQDERLAVAGWREVPVDPAACGALARASMPRIEQVFVTPTGGFDAVGFERSLFLARRRAEQQLRDEVGGMFVVSETQVQYHRPARLDDLLLVTARVRDAGRASLTIEQRAFLQPPQANTPPLLLCEGTIRIGWVDARQLRPQRIPAQVLSALQAPH